MVEKWLGITLALEHLRGESGLDGFKFRAWGQAGSSMKRKNLYEGRGELSHGRLTEDMKGAETGICLVGRVQKYMDFQP